VFDPEDSRRPGAPPGALHDPPDPRFWGPDRPPRHRRPTGRRPPGLGNDAKVAIAAVVVIVSATLISHEALGRSGSPPAPTGSSTPAPHVIVQVAGAVTKPGVIELPVGSRVIDAVDAVGGALPAADLDRLNLAAKLHDGEQVLVPTTTATTTSTPTTTTAPPPDTTTTPPPTG